MSQILEALQVHPGSTTTSELLLLTGALYFTVVLALALVANLLVGVFEFFQTR